jgi:DNA-binding Lrp family transcriptional regulator
MAASPASLEACGKALATLADVAFAAAVSGPHNLVASVACRSLPDLYRFIADDLARIDGLTAIEVVPIMTTVKQSTTAVDKGMLVELLPTPRV